MIPSTVNHAWNVTANEAKAIQMRLASHVIRSDDLSLQVRLVAGVDVAYVPNTDQVCAGVVVVDSESMDIVEQHTVIATTKYLYLPGLFAFRELPSVLLAFEQLRQWPDLIICDGHGIAHPRRFGLASHLGVLLDVPTIGCGKSRHIGQFVEPGAERGSFSLLYDNAEVIGCVLRTQSNVRPLFVSIGHRASLETARAWILRLSSACRQPEPIRRANEFVNQQRSKIGGI